MLTERIGSRTSDCESGMSELPSTTQSQPHVPTELQVTDTLLVAFYLAAVFLLFKCVMVVLNGIARFNPDM